MDRNEEEVVMSQAAHDAIVNQLKSEHAAALATATEAAKAEGAGLGKKAAHERLSAIVADEKVKGREITAIGLALKSPDMSAEDVAAFVATLPAASTVPSIAERAAAQGDISGGLTAGKVADAGRAGWAKAVDNSNRRRGLAN